MDNNERMPASMKDIAFKQVMNLIETLKRENNADYQVMLFTSTGTILGDIMPCSPENEMIKFTDDPEKFTLDTSSIFDILKREFKSGETYEYTYSDAYMLNVVNVIIFKPGSHDEYMRLNQMIIFTDQIIGFTVVNKRELPALLKNGVKVL